MKPNRLSAILRTRLLPAALVLAALPCFSRTIEVTPTGRDLSLKGGPYATLIGARNAIRMLRTQGHTNESYTVRIRPGVYWMDASFVLEPQDSGTAQHPVTYEVVKPEDTLFTGGRPPKLITEIDPGLWLIKPGRPGTAPDVDQLYMNSLRAIPAHSPPTGFFELGDVSQTLMPSNSGAEIRIKLPKEAMDALPDEKEGLVGAFLWVFHKWDTTRLPVSAIDRSNLAVISRTSAMKPWNPVKAGDRFMIEGSHVALDQPGEWLRVPGEGALYVAHEGQNVSDAMIIMAGGLERLIDIRGRPEAGAYVQHVRFKGLRLHHASYRIPDTGVPPVQAAAAIEAAVQADGARHVAFENCEIAHTGGYAIWFRRGCSDCRIEHCALEDLGAGGIRIGETVLRDNPSERTGGMVADNNIIRRIGRVHPSAVGVWIGESYGNSVTHNDIGYTYYTGISVGWTWGYGPSLATNNLIAYNRVHDIGQGLLDDMGGIYTLGNARGSRIVGNVFERIRSYNYGGWGIYTDEGSSGYLIASNAVTGTSCVQKPGGGGGFHQHYGSSNVVTRNIFANSTGPLVQASRLEDHLSFTFTNNLVVSLGEMFVGGSGNVQGPWKKLNAILDGNCYALVTNGPGSTVTNQPVAFAGSDFAAWQNAGRDKGSTQTNCAARELAAFRKQLRIPTPEAGVYGAAWKNQAAQPPP